MEFRKDDRVEMPTKPEWGLGRVVQDSAAGKVCVFFKEAGEKILSLRHVELVGVEGSEARDAWLDNLSAEPWSQGVRYVGPRRAIEQFLAKYPGGFRGERYLEEQRADKIAAHQLMLELLDREAARSLLQAEEFDEVCERALRVAAEANLVFPNEKTALRKALRDAAHRARFARGLDALLYGRAPSPARFKQFADLLAEMNGGKWTVATYFPFIRFPRQHVFLKPTVTPHAALLCRFDLCYRPEPNRLTYERLLVFARILRDALVDLEPVDMIDLHSFISLIAHRDG
jgi:hypothetical protein